MFDITNMHPVSTHIVIAGPDRGKSTLIMNLIMALRHVNKVFVVSGTENYNNFYKSVLPRSCLLDRFSPSTIKELLIDQGKHVRGTPPTPHVDEAHRIFARRGMLLIMDDLAFQAREIEKSSVFQEILMNHRHFHLTLIYAIQDPVLATRLTRDLFRYAWCFSEPGHGVRTRLHQWYFGAFRTFAEFDAAFRAYTSNYGAMMVSRREAGDGMSRDGTSSLPGIYCFRSVPNLPPFTLCSHMFWEGARRKGFSLEGGQKGAYKQNDPVCLRWAAHLNLTPRRLV